MGIEFYLVNRENKTFFDLGKGGWSSLKYDIEALQDKEYLADLIINEVFEPDNPNIGKEYADWLADELIKFVGQTEHKRLLVFGDNSDDPMIMKGLGFKCTGTRYVFDTEKDRQKYIDEENRHLSGNYRYNPSEQDANYFMNEQSIV